MDARGWTQKQLAEASGVSESAISRLYNARRHGMDWAGMVALAGALGSLEWYLCGAARIDAPTDYLPRPLAVVAAYARNHSVFADAEALSRAIESAAAMWDDAPVAGGSGAIFEWLRDRYWEALHAPAARPAVPPPAEKKRKSSSTRRL